MKRRLVGPLFSLVVLAFVLMPLVAQAYNLEGPRWPGQPSPGYCCANITWEQTAVYSVDATGWRNGANAWTNSPALVSFSNSTTPNIFAGDTNSSSVGWDGLTTYSSYTGNNGVKYFNNGTQVTLNYYYTQSYGTNEIQSVSTHEFGHSLGLAHTSACVIMNPYTSTRYSQCGVYVPQSDDIAGVNSLY
jgi:hypothetical protein